MPDAAAGANKLGCDMSGNWAQLERFHRAFPASAQFRFGREVRA
jgi:hypothetical protein